MKTIINLKVFYLIYFVLFFGSMFTCFPLQGQDKISQPVIYHIVEPVRDSGVVDTVDVLPEFIGGQEALARFISENKHYPDIAKSYNIHGTCYVEFVISSKGIPVRPSFRIAIGFGCDEEVMRLIKIMPTWKPALKNGLPCNAHFCLPVRF